MLGGEGGERNVVSLSLTKLLLTQTMGGIVLRCHRKHFNNIINFLYKIPSHLQRKFVCS